MNKVRLIDNKNISLGDILENNIPNYKHLSISTGYWDIQAMTNIIDDLFKYESVRLLIGKEPFIYTSEKKLKEKYKSADFPKEDIETDLAKLAGSKQDEVLRSTARKLSDLIEQGILKVRILRKPRLHAKTFIFGDEHSRNAIGIIGSSNFTYAGLNKNIELNYLENQAPLVVYERPNSEMPHTHLSWFNEVWDDDDVEEWTFEFKEVIDNSPLGKLTYGPYDAYIKTLMELFPDEIIPPQQLGEELEDILYTFQNRNAGILINKLKKMNVAILADSVGLGKTITAGAVIKHYVDTGQDNVQVIAPASLKNQWIDDLSQVLDLEERRGDYNIVSLQDVNAIEEIYEYYDKEWRRTKKINLFVIDEAHNLRSGTGARRDAILKLLEQHPDSHILLLTATPINNTLMDIANQIQLASKGKLTSVSVPYIRPGDNQLEMIDFFVALNRIQSQLKIAARDNKPFDYEKIKDTIHAGLRHYLVRSTRQGVEAEGSLVDKSGQTRAFPKSNVRSIDYSFESKSNEFVNEKVYAAIDECFEGINPLQLNLDLISLFTQQSLHPLDFIPEIESDENRIFERFDIHENEYQHLAPLLTNQEGNLVTSILRVIFMLGFTPYRPEVYKYDYYGKTVNQIRALEKNARLGIQLTIHNILQITWLKRLESSVYALLSSVKNYQKRIDLFEKYLDIGYIVSLEDASLLESDYGFGEDLEQAFADYDEYLKEREAALAANADPDDLKKRGVERRKADPKIYNIDQIKIDLEREKKIISLLCDVLTELSHPRHNSKMKSLADEIVKLHNENNYGEKILVFSFFADTIEYLQDNLHILLADKIPSFKERSEFISGRSRGVEDIVRRFSPVSKKYQLKPDDQKIDYLFSTDILSEGQNLQDAGILINFDLHWNPVRMIQRNGRINRLGSQFSEVLIGNLKPADDLEMYLKLVNKLENKINTIKNTIGLDQGVLDNKDVNPIEFIERYYEDGELPQEEDDDLLAHTDEHILALREFIAHSTVEEQQFIKDMPIGKWSYLPNDSTKTNYVLTLMNATGATSSGEPIDDLYFIEVDCAGEYIGGYIDFANALDIIKASKDDNERIVDNITFNRDRVYARASVEAKRQAENIRETFRITPSVERALLELSRYLPNGIDLKGIIQRGLNNITDVNEARSIFRQTNSEVKNIGSPQMTTINRFTRLIEKLQTELAEERFIKSTKGVLYYGSRK